MSSGRLVLIVTCLIVAALGVVLVVLRWDAANRIATVASALGAVAAVGVAVWAVLRGSGTRVSVENTGDAHASGGGVANTGIRVE